MADGKGKVYLVGAGPGDEELLTVKAADVIKKADVIVYDRLISDGILSKFPTMRRKSMLEKCRQSSGSSA